MNEAFKMRRAAMVLTVCEGGQGVLMTTFESLERSGWAGCAAG